MSSLSIRTDDQPLHIHHGLRPGAIHERVFIEDEGQALVLDEGVGSGAAGEGVALGDELVAAVEAVVATVAEELVEALAARPVRQDGGDHD